MLAEEDKTRIQAEEVFRLEVRRKLEAIELSLARRVRLGAWLNSSFGLWVLSSVVLTGLTTAYTYYQNKRGEQAKKEETERRLDNEISGRMSAALARLRVDELGIEKGLFDPPADIYSGDVGYLDNSFISDPHPQDFSIYPEYQKRTFRSLLFELSTIVAQAALPELREAVALWMRFKDLASIPTGAADAAERKRESTQGVDDSVQRLESQMKGRWRSRM